MSEHDTIFIVDDDAAVRDSLTMLLEAAGYAAKAFKSAADFLGTCVPDMQGCIILDVDMPGMDGPSLQEELIRRHVNLPVLFLSGHGNIPMTVRTVKAGAIDFLTKPIEGLKLLEHVRAALKQRQFMHHRIAYQQFTLSRLATLTAREKEILLLAIAGHPSKEIGSRLGLSYRTVEIHRAHILRKTGASNLLELASIAGFFESLQVSP